MTDTPLHFVRNKLVYLSIVIPAYNEEHNIRSGVLGAVNDYLRDRQYSWEALIVDDGSKDKTVEYVENFVARHKGFRLIREPHRGKGGTVIAGMLKADGKYILFTDMDQATPLPEVEKLLSKLKEGFDIAIGSRAGREGAPIVRKVMAYGFALLRTVALRLPFKDTQCGFKIFEKEAARKIFQKMKVFNDKKLIKGAAVTAGFDLELLYIARKLGYKVAEVPVVWHHKEGTKVNPIKDSWEGLRDLLRVRINAFLGKYR